MADMETIRETPFGDCIGARIIDITTGEHGEEDADKVYFHLDNGQTFFATIGMTGTGDDSKQGLLGFIDMDAKEDE